jgi:thioesterase domain-containing protein
MKKKEIEKYLHQYIPISYAMGIQVISASFQEVTLFAPFTNNINHKKTVFGGSLHAVATLACWSLLHLNLQDLNPLDLVITHSNVKYLFPVTTDFQAQCQIPEREVWQRFLKILTLKGKSRIDLQAKIFQNEQLAVDYQGTFAAIKKPLIP